MRDSCAPRRSGAPGEAQPERNVADQTENGRLSFLQHIPNVAQDERASCVAERGVAKGDGNDRKAVARAKRRSGQCLADFSVLTNRVELRRVASSFNIVVKSIRKWAGYATDRD